MRDLGRIVSPERVLSSALERVARSRDASIYRMVPEAVVRPRDVGEVRALFAYARRHGRHLTFRGGGTSLSGQAVGDDLLVELGPHWSGHRVLEGGASVWTQPGVVGGHLNRRLGARHRIGPDPASIDAATIGGIVANNSSGMCCGVAQNAYHTLAAATIVLTDGTVVDTAQPDADARLRAASPAVHAGLLRLRDDVRDDAVLRDRIRTKFARKNTTGYSLNAFLDYDAPAEILARLMVGSEGTLAFLADVTLRTIAEPPARATGLFVFADLPGAGAAVPPLAEAGADAVEILDATCLRVLDRAGHGPFPSGAEAALLVEFRREDEAALAAVVAAAESLFSRARVLSPAAFTRDATRRAALWKMRKGLAPATGALRPSGTAYMTEDVAFPVERLASAVADCQALFTQHGLPDTILFGHAKDGNLHFVLSQDLRRAESVARYDRFLRGLVELVVGTYDGALKAEHGAGRNMAPFVRAEWGERAYAIMRRVKALLDPDGILSPGVVLNDDPQGHLRHLKPVPSVEPEIDACTECGLCEPRCPSRNLTLTPRQRIVVKRELASLAEGSSPSSARQRAELSKAFAYHGIETCAGDSMCGVACPVGIDTGRLMKAERAAGRSALANALAAAAASRFEATTRLAGLGLEFVAGERSAPPLPPVPQVRGRPRVVYFPSCVTRTVASAPAAVPVARAMLDVLDAAGLDASYPEDVGALCCGLAFESKGFPTAGHDARERTLAALHRASGKDRAPIVTDASPCARALQSADPAILDFPSFWARRVLDGAMPEGGRRLPGTVVLHPTCSLVASGGVADLTAVARAHAEDVVVPVSAECCGFAGDRGFSVPELTASATVAEAAEVRAIATTRHYSTCRTCEIGLARATGQPYLSLVHLVHEALGLG